MKSKLTLLKLVRAPAGLTAVSNIIAAAVIASNNQLSADIILLICASIFLYFSGMALNDCFDYQEDFSERATRPIPSGEISLKNAWLFGISLMAAGILFAFSYSLSAGFISIALATAIVLYNGVIKKGFIGSICMASCRYVNWLLGASFVGLAASSYLMALPIFFYIVGLTFLSKQETHGENKSAVIVCALMLTLTAASILYLVEYQFALNHFEYLTAFVLLAIWCLLIASKLIKIFNNFTPGNIQQLIGWMVIGVIPLDALLVAASGEYIVSLIILALLPPCRMLNKYLYVT
ncbi:MAG: UbiA family prenyltransferase [Thalassotalea sp.]